MRSSASNRPERSRRTSYRAEIRTGRMVEILDGYAANLRRRNLEVPGCTNTLWERYRNLQQAGLRSGLSTEDPAGGL